MQANASHDSARRDVAPWWREAVIYQIYIHSFKDGNGEDRKSVV